MRKSPQKHTVAILRNIICLTQAKFGKLVHKSGRTIQMIELNSNYRLTPELADKISYETHVDLDWLLRNDVSKPPISQYKKPYTKEDFEWAQAVNCGKAIDKSSPEGFIVELQVLFATLVARIGATALAAQKSGKVNLFRWKSTRAIEELEHEFGASASDANALLSAWPPWRGETYDLEEFKLDSMMKLLNIRFVLKELQRAKLKSNQLNRNGVLARAITGGKKTKRRAS
jgi:transcriptional regulator with XRE-family HTH domain